MQVDHKGVAMEREDSEAIVAVATSALDLSDGEPRTPEDAAWVYAALCARYGARPRPEHDFDAGLGSFRP